MTPLRILMFTTFYPPYSFGGDAVGVQRMARALVARGHQVMVVHDENAFLNLGGAQPADAALEAGDGIGRVGLRAKNGIIANLMVQQTGRPVQHAREIQQIVDQFQPDITWYNNASLIGGPGIMDYGTGLKVFEAHEHWLVCPSHVLWRYNKELCDAKECLRCVLSFKRPPQLWRYTGMVERKLDQVDMIVSKSEFSRAKHAEFGLKQDMTTLPYFLPDMDHNATEAYTGHPRPYFLFVGRLEKIKGLQDVFPAMDKVDADLLILGDGDYADELKRQAAGNPKIKFLGRMTPDELTAYYKGAQGLIVPSVCYETFGIILIESFRLGTPVIARRLGPFPEIVEESGGGLLFETEDDLVTAMRSFQEDASLRDRLSTAARAGFEDRWREDVVMAAWGASLADAADRAGKTDLAARLKAGLFENGIVPAQAAE